MYPKIIHPQLSQGRLLFQPLHNIKFKSSTYKRMPKETQLGRNSKQQTCLFRCAGRPPHERRGRHILSLFTQLSLTLWSSRAKLLGKLECHVHTTPAGGRPGLPRPSRRVFDLYKYQYWGLVRPPFSSSFQAI